MTDIVWAVYGLSAIVFVVACGVGHELWKMNGTLERIADRLDENAEGERDDE